VIGINSEVYGVFEQEIDQVLAYVTQGLSVGVVGGPGSGRTSVAKEVASRLANELGFDVLIVSPGRSLAAQPFTWTVPMELNDVSFDLEGQRVPEPLSIQGGASVVVVDDVENLDSETLAAIELLRTQRQIPSVITLDDVPLRTRFKSMRHWADVTVSLSGLRYAQISELIIKLLGHPGDADLISGVLFGSGGNLRLAVRIIESAAHTGRVIFLDDVWRMNGTELLNEHLQTAIEASLSGLREKDLKALIMVSMLAPCPVDDLVPIVGAAALDRLELRRLVAVHKDGSGSLQASVFSVIVGDYLKSNALDSRKVLASAIIQRQSKTASPGMIEFPDTSAADVLKELRSEMKGNHAARVWYFRREIESQEQVNFENWAADRSLSNAVSYLRISWALAVRRDRIEEVLEETPLATGDAAELMFFAMTRALLGVLEGHDLSASRQIMNQLAESVPGRAVEAEAFYMFLQASYGGLPDDLDDVLARLGDHSTGVIAVIKGLLELFRFNPDGALRCIDSFEEHGCLPRFGPFIRSLALYSKGNIDEALVHSLTHRGNAIAEADQFSLVTQSYVAAIALLHRGLFDEAEYLMNWVFAVQKPGIFTWSLCNAMLRLASLRKGPTSPVLRELATDFHVGPLPGLGQGFHELVFGDGNSTAGFDESAGRLIAEQLTSGFVLAAVHSGLFLLCLSPGPLVKNSVRTALQARGTSVHDQLLDIADAVVEGDLQELIRRVDTYRPDENIYLTAMLLKSASRRSRLAGNFASAVAIERVVEAFIARFRPSGHFITFEPDVAEPALTDRESGIALLAGHRTNQDIASRLGLSIRTVENHISNALRKTGTTTRKALFEHVRRAQKGSSRHVGPRPAGAENLSPLQREAQSRRSAQGA
jgi:DNA-binding CsgD family transcriptional regulator